MTTVDTFELEGKLKHIYREVAEHPKGDFHFELGSKLVVADKQAVTSISASLRSWTDGR
ncbi:MULTISPECIES: hypothetical protein [Nocardioides]|uniref:Uncharacterized protein n=1 Tax=Nocardioides vastitatis TaxID=2568655 RepID=A0ABW0ZDH9_9ACTN|nr:hypothetical protein [Nocardioides sp.]